MTIAAMTAVEKESILKPLMKWEAIKSKMALMTNMKSPRERMVAGKVRSIKTGLSRRLSIPKTAATTKAVKVESILNPGTK